MARAIIYTKEYCSFCHRAKETMDELGIEYTEIDVTHDPKAKEEMVTRSGRTTLPQIFLHVGGSDDFHALLSKGALKEIVGGDFQDKDCASGQCSI